MWTDNGPNPAQFRWCWMDAETRKAGVWEPALLAVIWTLTGIFIACKSFWRLIMPDCDIIQLTPLFLIGWDPPCDRPKCAKKAAGRENEAAEAQGKDDTKEWPYSDVMETLLKYMWQGHAGAQCQPTYSTTQCTLHAMNTGLSVALECSLESLFPCGTFNFLNLDLG